MVLWSGWEKPSEIVPPDFEILEDGTKTEANALKRKGPVWLMAPGAGHIRTLCVAPDAHIRQIFRKIQRLNGGLLIIAN